MLKQIISDVHFIGLVSDGGVHSHIKHVKGLCDAAGEFGLEKVFIHAFLDGRDTDPKRGHWVLLPIWRIILARHPG
jgi:2,3-bisphosphoglycerate-independent phosphoglycerate mutase